MNCRFIRKTKGAIAVFLTVIMLGMVVFEGVMIDTSRIIAAKTVTSGAGDLALNSALTNYDKVLYEVYGLFASATDEADLDAKINEYFNQTLQGAGIDGSLDDVSNMLNLMMASGSSVSLQGVKGSQLSNEDVIENQILEYMKFRAPVNIGFGFLEKLESFRDFNKQSEAMEAQMDFEEKLESMQDACQNVYDKANALKEFDETQIGANKDALEQGAGVLKTYAAAYNEVVGLKENIEGHDFNDDPSWINGVSYTTIDWKNTEADYRGTFTKDYINSFIEFEEKNGKESLPYNKFYQAYVNVKEIDNELVDAYTKYNTDKNLSLFGTRLVEYVEKATINNADIRELYWVLNHYNKWYQLMVVGGKDETLTDEEIAHYEEFNNKYSGIINNQITEIENKGILKRYTPSVDFYKVEMSTYYKNNLYSPLNSAWEKTEKGKLLADELIKAIDCGSHTSDEEKFCCLKRAIDVTEKYKTKWSGKIEALGDSSTKSSMQGTFDSEAKGIDSSQYQALLGIANSVNEYCNGYQEYIGGVYIHEGDSKKQVYNKDSIDCDKVGEYVKAYGSDNLIAIEKSAPATPNPNFKTQIENDSFYKYLQNICSEKEKKVKKEDKEEAKDTKSNLLAKGKEDTSISSGDIAAVDSSIWVTANALYAVENGDKPGATKVEETSSNKETTKSAKSSLNSTKDLFSSVESILVNARDSIYITEYATGMFSCYTTGVKEANEAAANGEEAAKIYTIAGNSDTYNLLSKDYNRLWRAEQEYILWGDPDPVKDVNNTMLAIFGIRFALNLLYAFTGDAEIEATTLAWATAIAGWTGFGVPIVQTVLKIALALAESVYDMTVLKKGEDLVIYKSTNTWVMKPSGIASKGVDAVASEATQLAKGAIDSAFDYVDKVTTDTIDEVASSVAATIEDTKDSMIENAVNYVLAPFGNTFVSLVSQADANVQDTLNNVLSTTKSNVDTKTELGKLEGYLLDNYGDMIVSQLSAQVTNARNSAEAAYDDAVESLKQTLKDKAKISPYITNLGNELDAEVSAALDKAKAGAEEAAGEAINSAMSKFVDSAQGYGETGKKSVTRGFALTLNYQEYVHIFLILKGLGNNTSYIRRVAQLIQLNMEMRKGGSFSLANKYTLLQLNAEVQVNTVFFGKLDSFLENPLNAKDTYTLKYCGLQGY